MSNTRSPVAGAGARAVAAFRPVQRVVASYTKANEYLGEAQKTQDPTLPLL